ncbi:MAG TPA: hypothetical protein VGG39_07415 [Polyangiaceae bacterium]|jgi:hypothetical protein
MRDRRLPLVALGIALAVLTACKVACVLAGPDVDTDAYAHHMIARAILADPHDLSVHWVWLPLFHYAQVPLVALGGTMQDVRWLDVLLSGALPVAVFAYVRRTARTAGSLLSADAVALVAALVAAASPIVLQMGTTAQPEPLFALVVFGVAVTFQERRYGWAAVLLAAAVMLRYEAWASLATVAVVVVVEPSWRRRRALPLEPHPWQAWITIALPVVLILAWAALRRPVDGTWFGFLSQTKEFANDATHARFGLARDAFYYPVAVALRVLGTVMILVPFGVVRAVRQQGARFVLVLLACLGMVSLSWITRSSLGLDRHFVCIVPLYAIFAAQGMAAVADFVAALVAARTSRARAATAGRAVAAALAVVALGGLFVEDDVWIGFWRASIARGWPDRAALAAYVRGIPGSPTVFCDDATFEMLTGLDRRRFDRHWIDDPHTWDVIDAEARAHGPVYVATWRRKLVGHEDEGPIVFVGGQDPANPAGTGVAVMRVQR